MRKATGRDDPEAARQIRDGIGLAVKLADRLQKNDCKLGERAASGGGA